MNWKTISRSFALINFKASATATFKLAHIKDYMAMTSTLNRTCFPNPPGCCMYRLPYKQVGPDIKGSRWVAFLLSVGWNWYPHTASGQHALILFISHSRGDRYRQCRRYAKHHPDKVYLQGQGCSAHIPEVRIWVITLYCQVGWRLLSMTQGGGGGYLSR